MTDTDSGVVVVVVCRTARDAGRHVHGQDEHRRRAALVQDVRAQAQDPHPVNFTTPRRIRQATSPLVDTIPGDSFVLQADCIHVESITKECFLFLLLCLCPSLGERCSRLNGDTGPSWLACRQAVADQWRAKRRAAQLGTEIHRTGPGRFLIPNQADCIATSVWCPYVRRPVETIF